jgi:diguanylate cyclase (GGDEF)-like protein
LFDSTGPSLILLAVSLVVLFLAAYAAAHRRVHVAPEFARLMTAAAIYAMGYGLELTKVTTSSIMTVIWFEYLGIATAPVFWVLFAYRFSRPSKTGPRPLVVAALFVLPAVILLSVWTNDFHHLYYARVWMRTDGPFPVLGIDRGPLYWLSIINIQVCIFIGTAILVVHAAKSPPFIRRQAIVAAIGSLGPWLGNALYVMGWTPWGLEPSSFFLALGGIAFYVSIFRLGFFELVPAARDRAIESLRDGFIVVDGNGRVVDANRAASELFGEGAIRIGYPLGREDGLPDPLGRLVDRPETELSLAGPSGAERRLVVQAFPVVIGRASKEGCALIVRDVTENSALLASLSRLAGTDELTGLHNRRRFSEDARHALAFALRDQRSITLAILDIDHFKEINDRFGHAAGDIALKVFAERLSKSLRAADLLCRYGGEEFAVLLTSAEPSTAVAAIERMRIAATREDILWEGGAIGIRASAGLYTAIPGRVDSLDNFLDAADAALYEAKAAGRDRSILSRAPATLVG